MTSKTLLLVGDSESNPNLYYKTHFLAGDPFVYVERDDRRILVVSSMEQGRAVKESHVPEVRSFDDFGYLDLVRETGDRSRAFTLLLSRILGEAGSDGATVEGLFPVAYADALRAENVALEVDPNLLRDERRRKSTEEVGAIEAAQRATESAAQRAIEILAASDEVSGTLHFTGIPLSAERLRTEIEVLLTREGMDPGDVIVAGGPGAADPHWRGSGPLRAGEAIVLDIFPRSKATRYYADMTRTVVKGQPGDTLRRMYDATLAAQETALALIRPGAMGEEIHAAVVEVFKRAGFDSDVGGPRYIHGTGHGVGLEIHEGPGISTAAGALREGDVVTVEPGLYDPDIGGIRIEDLVVVTAGGNRNLTRFPKQFEL